MKTYLIMATVVAICITIAVLAWFPRTPEPVSLSQQDLETALQYDPLQAVKRAQERGIGREARKGQNHIHIALRIVIDGGEHHPPKTLGLVDAGPRLAIHSHDFSGVVHVHHPKEKSPWKLQDIWAVWGIPYSATMFSSWKFNKGWKGKIYVDNTPYAFGQDVVLEDRMDIVVSLASPGSPLPAQHPLEPFDWKTAPIRES